MAETEGPRDAVKGPAAIAGAAPGLGFRALRWALAFTMALVALGIYAWIAARNQTRFDERLVTPWALWTPLDRRLPTLPWMIWPYMLYYVLIFVPVFLTRELMDVAEVLTAFVVVSAIAWLAYLMWPVRMIYPALACTGEACRMLHGLYLMDGGVNVMPSLHAAHSLLAALIFYTYRNRFAPAVLVAALAVSAAAVLTRQHYVADILAGFAVGGAGWALTRVAFGWVRG